MYTDIKTFEDACIKLSLDPTQLPDFFMMPEKHQAALTAHTKLIIIAEAINEDWKPDWSDDDQYKYFPWFYMDDAGAADGFSYLVSDCLYTTSYVSSRLCFESRDKAKYIGTQFIDLYRDYFILKE